MKRYVFVCAMLLVASGYAQDVAKQPEEDKWVPKIDKVFFAQQHVQEPSDPLFKLVGNLPALIKVQVYSDVPREAPSVVAVLELGKKSDELTLRGPKQLPKPYTGEPILMPHSYEDSFTGLIPKEWIKPGLKVTIELRNYSYLHNYNPPGHTGVTVLDRKVLDNLRVGAGNKLILTLFDIHFFEEEKDVDFPQGWEREMADKLPVAEFEVQRVRGIVFPELIMPGSPPIRCRSTKEYEERTEQRFDNESAAARVWMRALKRAGGRNYGHGVVFLSLAFVPANGWGESWSMAGTTDLGRTGNFHHEMGHVFSLPHWGGNKSYPYVGEMYGIKAQSANLPHAGPKWAYSLHQRAFISPIVQADGRVGGVVGIWKKDPMQGGGFGDQKKDYMMRHFSDYSVNQMQNFAEKKMLFWNETEKAYFTWNEETKSFSTKMESDGWNLATDPFAEVISVIASASAGTPEANFVYPPIGPYKAGLLTRFDATSEKDREQAKKLGFSDKTCDVCLRVTQGGKTTTCLLEMKRDPLPDQKKEASYVTTAINLPAGDGKVTKAELLHTPGVISKGVADDAKVLYSWTAKTNWLSSRKGKNGAER